MKMQKMLTIATVLMSVLCTAQPAAIAQDVQVRDTVNHFSLSIGGNTSVYTPLTIRSSINATGMGTGTSFIKDFSPLSAGEVALGYSVRDNAGVLRLSLTNMHMAGNNTSSIMSDARYKPVAESSSQTSLRASMLLFGLDKYTTLHDRLSTFWGSYVGVFWAGEDNVTSTDYTNLANGNLAQSVMREGYTRELAPVVSATVGLRFDLTNNWAIEARGSYAYVPSTHYASTLTLSETVNNVATTIGTSTTMRAIDGFRFGLHFSIRLW